MPPVYHRNTKYLRQDNGSIHVYDEYLAKRKDMHLYDPFAVQEKAQSSLETLAKTMKPEQFLALLGNLTQSVGPLADMAKSVLDHLGPTTASVEPETVDPIETAHTTWVTPTGLQSIPSVEVESLPPAQSTVSIEAVKTMNKQQLLEYANEVLQLKLSAQLSKPELVAEVTTHMIAMENRQIMDLRQ